MRALLIAACLLATPAAAQTNIQDFRQAEKLPDEFFMITEIPAGGFTKYELDHATGFLFVDRFQSMPVAYPVNYGSVSQTLADDGDPLDAVVYTRAPLQPGSLIRVRPIGIMKMIDAGEVDDKIVAVPTSKLDPTYDDIKTVDDLPAIERERLMAFFRVYKQLPAGRKVVEVSGFEGIDAAKAMLLKAHETYKRAKP